MNGGRFDELAKGLATNRFSRGQVLKGFVAGALLATPLGGLLNRRASAQDADCVAPECTESAQEGYAACGRRCKRLGSSRKRKKCQKECQVSYSGQLLDCGCLEINSDTATGKTTYVPCEDPCMPQTLSEQAHQDPHYSTLADYLTVVGFAADADPDPVVFQQDGQLVRSLLVTTYSNPTRTNEIATLTYNLEASGEAPVLAFVQDKQDATLLYLLVVDGAGLVQKVSHLEDPEQASEALQQTDGSNAVSSAAAAKACVSGKLSNCLRDARLDLKLCLLAAKRRSQVVVCMATYARDLVKCSSEEGCGPLTDFWCSNDVCCPLRETGCGGNTCCNGCQRCENGSCVSALCPADRTCCSGPLNTECCSPCEECFINPFFVAICGPSSDPNAKPCGDSCCGSCQTCEGGQCRNCNDCEVCQDGDCVPKTCDPPRALNPDTCQCECQVTCPTGQSPDQDCVCRRRCASDGGCSTRVELIDQQHVPSVPCGYCANGGCVEGCPEGQGCYSKLDGWYYDYVAGQNHFFWTGVCCAKPCLNPAGNLGDCCEPNQTCEPNSSGAVCI